MILLVERRVSYLYRVECGIDVTHEKLASSLLAHQTSKTIKNITKFPSQTTVQITNKILTNLQQPDYDRYQEI